MAPSLFTSRAWRAAIGPAPAPRRILAAARIGRTYRVQGSRILVTGASSGVGRAAALALAAHGAELVIAARRETELDSVRAEIERAGGAATVAACDLTDSADVGRLVALVEDRMGSVEVLINNAGRSIRRSLPESLDRFHDFERTMAINYFGAVRLTLGLLPLMTAAGGGHVVNVGTWTVPTGASPNFAAYHSSKAALTAFGRCLGAELADAGIAVSEVHFPLVHTAMSAPTEKFRALKGLTAEEAADWIVTAVRTRPARLIPRYAAALSTLGTISPRTVDKLLRYGN